MIAAVLATLLLGQLQLTEIRGVATDDTGGVLPGATIELTDSLGAPIAKTETDGLGHFVFRNVAPGRYMLLTSLAGFRDASRPVTVTNAIALEVTVRMRLSEISENPLTIVAPDTPATRASIGSESIASVPVRSVAKALQEVVATLPGWATEDNGLLHSRGTDDGFLYVIDGIPVYERLDQLSGIAPDTSMLESINVMTGYLPPEFGYRAGGVIDVRSKAVYTAWTAALAVDAGSDDTSALSGMAGGRLSRHLATTIGTAWQRSDRFLDPIHPDNFHNRGDVATVSAGLTWTSPRVIFSASAGGGVSDYEVPNTEQQQHASQNQRQRIDQRFGTANWQHAWSQSFNSQVSAYARQSSADLRGSEVDTPLFALASRDLTRFGAIGSATWNHDDHTVKAGAEFQHLSMRESFAFAVTDPEAAEDAGFSDSALEFDVGNPFVFAGSASPTLFSTYLQDDWQAVSGMTISGGVRIDRTALLLPRTQISPRVGITYRIDQTVLRASVSRFFQPPQPEYLLLSSSPEARVLSQFAYGDTGGGADIEPERQWGFESGVAHDITDRVRLDGALWYRSMTDAADPNVFAGTTIIFPNAVATGRAYGLDLLLEVRRQRAWSGYASFATGRVRQRGPLTGGLFLEDEVAEIADGEEFIPDHDQAVVASGGVMWTHPSRPASVSLAVRYESGTPIGDVEDAEGQPGAELVDFDRGRVKPRAIASLQAQAPVFKRGKTSATLRFTLQNMFDTDYAYNFGNAFSGTHFGAPRTASIGVRVAF